MQSLPSNLPSVEKLIQKLSVAEKTQQKEVRITIQEARDLCTELAIITSRLGKTVQEIYIALEEIKKASTQIDIKFDGGGFSER